MLLGARCCRGIGAFGERDRRPCLGLGQPLFALKVTPSSRVRSAPI